MATLQVALVEPVSVKKAIFNQTVVNVTREPTMGLIVNVSRACICTSLVPRPSPEKLGVAWVRGYICTTNGAIAMYIAAR